MRSDGTGPADGRTRGIASLARLGGGLLLASLIVGAPLQAQEDTTTASPGEHEVDRGDTLWDLARQFLSDPFDWRRIYQLNQQKIEDPHWIYPGQVFAIPGRVAGAAEEEGEVTGVEVRERQPGEAEPDPEPEAEPADRDAPAGGDPFAGPSIFDQNPQQGVSMGGLDVGERPPPALVTASDFYKVSFLDDFETVRPRGTTARVIRENPLGLDMPPSVRLRDRVVIALGGLRVQTGDTLQAVRRLRSVGPDQDVVESLGLVEVSRVQGDSARGVVTAVYGGYQVGDPVIRAEPFRSGVVRTHRPARDRLRGRVAALALEQVLVSTGDVAFLDVGSTDGVELGDEFAVYPDGEIETATRRFEDRLGVVRVVRVRPETSTVRVVETRDVGMRVGLPAVRFRRPASPAE